MIKYKLKVKNKISNERYMELLHLPLYDKIIKTEMAIQDWYNYWNGKVYVSFSGGLDSTVLLDLVRSLYDEVPGVFLDTGLEYPEIRKFVKTKENIVWLKPKTTFVETIEKWGYPIISKEIANKIYVCRNTTSEKQIFKMIYGYRCHDNRFRGKISKKWMYLLDAPFKISSHCCYDLKKYPIGSFVRRTKLHGFVGTRANESALRLQNYLRIGCNNFKNTGVSTPLSYWTRNDILEYIKMFNLDYCNLYDRGINGTGCMFCCFGLTYQESPNKFELMKDMHPKLYNYCMKNLELAKVLSWVKIKGKLSFKF